MKKLKTINNEAARYALHQCKKNDKLTMGDFDMYHNDYIYCFAQKEGLTLEKQYKIVDICGKHYNQYKAQIEALKAQKKALKEHASICAQQYDNIYKVDKSCDLVPFINEYIKENHITDISLTNENKIETVNLSDFQSWVYSAYSKI